MTKYSSFNAQEKRMIDELDQINDMSNRLRYECTEYLKAFVYQHGKLDEETNTYYLDLVKPDWVAGEDDDDCDRYVIGRVTCTFDGEYVGLGTDAHIGSTIESLALTGDTLTLDLEDWEGYDIDWLDNDEVMWIARCLCESKDEFEPHEEK